MKRGELLYEGKAKKVYHTDDPGFYRVEFKDDATAFDGMKKERLAGKGALNNRISALCFKLLEGKGVDTHFVRTLSDREMLVKALQIIPLEVIVRNIAAGSLSRRLGIPEGTVLDRTVVELCYKDDTLHDPMVNNYHVYAMKLATPAELAVLEARALRVNEILQPFLAERGIILVDFKLEFGRHGDKILLGDEISPDTCRFWDYAGGDKLDKDRFRQDLGRVVEAYREALRRMEGGVLDAVDGQN